MARSTVETAPSPPAYDRFGPRRAVACPGRPPVDQGQDLLDVLLAVILADRLGFSLPLKEADYTEFAVRAAGFSLVRQGLVSTGEKAKVPLLVINTIDDDIAPPSDVELLAASAETSEVMYMGEGGHCGDKGTMVSMMVPWLVPYLLASGQ